MSWAKDAGLACRPAGDGVEHRALSRACGSDQDDKEGGVQRRGPDTHMTGQVVGQSGGSGGGGLASGPGGDTTLC